MKKKDLEHQLKETKLLELNIEATNILGKTEEMFEMVNLRQHQTGIPGVLYISTQQSSHAPRVKYYQKADFQNAPSFSVSISENPKVIVSSLPNHIVNDISPLVIEWVKLNNQDLLKYWKYGLNWSTDEQNTFYNNFHKVNQKN